jgi:uncharacterized membrane protein
MSDKRKQLLLITGIAVGLGSVLVLNRRNRRRARAPVPDATWSITARLAAAAAGGALLLYGTGTPGKWGHVASTTGAGLLMRSINDEPISKLTDVIQPRTLLAG